MPVAPDTGAFDKLKSFDDYKRINDEFLLKKALTQAQIAKANEVDADKLGQTAFLKAAQGIPLSPQEGAALKYLDAKSPTAAFNPVTGVLEQKPSLLDRAGLDAPASSQRPAPNKQPAMTPKQARDVIDLYGDSPWDAEYQAQLGAAAGNPKLQQVIKENYAKSKIGMNESESKSAGYADRMLNSNSILGRDNIVSAATDVAKQAKSTIPVIGNMIVGDDYQSYDQARRDFVNAILRRESGAVISPSEFENANKQYFPQPGDSPETIQQKAANREAAINGVRRSAGPAYKAPEIPNIGGGIPDGAKLFGTSGGKKVYKLPNGTFVMEQ